MANTKISALTNASALGGTEQLAGVQSAGNVNITPAQIKTFTSASPTLVTPALGTPSSGTLTNCTGLPAAGVVNTAAVTGAANTFATGQIVGLGGAGTNLGKLILDGGSGAGGGPQLAGHVASVLKWALSSYSGIIGSGTDPDPTFYNAVNAGKVYVYNGAKYEMAHAQNLAAWATAISTALTLGTTAKTVATLGSASPAGQIDYVTDALTTLALGLGATVAAGGSNKTPVTSDGSNWKYG